MKSWNDITNIALIGADKMQLTVDEFTGELAEAFGQINSAPSLDKEEQFLQLASVAYNFRQSGSTAITSQSIKSSVAPIEENGYCGVPAVNILKDILDENSMGLLKIWLDECGGKNNIVTTEIVPALLEVAAAQKNLRTQILACCGKRAAWLAGFNTAWNFVGTATDDEMWNTGTAEQRKLVLRQLCLTDRQRALALLKQTWPDENANSKAELLKQLAVNHGADDLEWLESLQQEKSQKVKDQVLELLKQIPESALVKQYLQVLRQALVLKKEKSLLGIISKTSLHIDLSATVDDQVFITGIEKLSNKKEFTDEEYVVYQLLHGVPLSFLEDHLSLSPENIINLFEKDKHLKKFIAALVLSVARFKNERWAIFLMQYSAVFYLDLIPLLPLQQKLYYSKKFFDQHELSTIEYATQFESEWDVELTKLIFGYLAKNPYNFNRTFYNNNIHLIPLAIAGELESFAPQEEYLRTMWSNTSEYILKLLNLKSQIAKAFI